ncbi:hypothetical protein [Haliangium ochraceum]|uniref:Tetratricopeptide repeat protein n=1 Tax=Haliangium ochraceum (strain DSM 14365 / JCM 11303 / SMP-2) TaxID=502025 RepID=D0LJC3_HALO1|nr:hypothetical protein [Haliangium ochraceum]ACY14970.1 hypothetical protein Hoch_2433 [Haliangium ochraceum DSM 14365]
MIRSLFTGALTVLAISLAASSGHAAPAPTQPAPAWPWGDEDHTDAAYQELLQKGDRLALQAMEMRRALRVRRRHHQLGERIALNAVASYEAAAERRPGEGEPHYRAAEVLRAHFLSLDSPGRSDPVIRDRALAERALAHWSAFEDLEPLDPRVTATLFERALVRTRLATEDDFQHAIRHYELLLQRSDLSALGGDAAATWLSNLAETYMMVGRLSEAIAMYKRSLAYGSQPSYGYGLAVALDRDGQYHLAREVMQAYAATDNMRDLRRGSVFFVPAGELDYYLALGYEALGEFAKASEHYQRFIASGAHPRYHAQARANIERIADAARRGGGGPGRTLPGRPGGRERP